MRAALGGDAFHAGILDAHLLRQQGNFLSKSVDADFQADPGIDAIRGDAACEGKEEVSQGDQVNHGGSNPFGPAPGQKESEIRSG